MAVEVSTTQGLARVLIWWIRHGLQQSNDVEDPGLDMESTIAKPDVGSRRHFSADVLAGFSMACKHATHRPDSCPAIGSRLQPRKAHILIDSVPRRVLTLFMRQLA